jgi:hypothetical protein
MPGTPNSSPKGQRARRRMTHSSTRRAAVGALPFCRGGVWEKMEFCQSGRLLRGPAQIRMRAFTHAARMTDKSTEKWTHG